MSPYQKWLVWASSTLTGVTGLAYWWMKNRMEPLDQFAVINHPLQPWILKAHILVAPVMVFAFGAIAGDHIWRQYRQRVRAGRRSGLLSAWVIAPMILSGYLIQAVTHAGWLSALAWAHLVTGVVYLVGLVAHHRVVRTLWPRVTPVPGRTLDPMAMGALPRSPADGAPYGRIDSSVGTIASTRKGGMR